MTRFPAGVVLIASLLAWACTAAPPEPRPDFTGVWSTTMTTPDDDAWRLEDHGCFAGCPASVYQRLRELLQDPANDDRPYESLMGDARRYGREQLAAILTPEGRARFDELGLSDDRAISCKPPGFVREVLNPVPLEITQHDDRVVLRYEAWGVVRNVYMDGRGHPEGAAPTLHGHSVGRYDGSALVIDTRGIAADHFYPGFGVHSDQLHAVERYTRSEDQAWLRLEITFDDPVMLREP
jgi:hypothetical protein